MRKALFLDRDGTINVDFGYVHEPDRFVFIEGIVPFCQRAQDLGYLIIIITNQSGISRGYYTEDDYRELTDYMLKCFAAKDVVITDVLHSPDLSGPNRKPQPGLFLAARDKYDIDMSKSVNVGDKQRDVEAGRAAGVGTNVLFEGQFPYSVLS